MVDLLWQVCYFQLVDWLHYSIAVSHLKENIVFLGILGAMGITKKL